MQPGGPVRQLYIPTRFLAPHKLFKNSSRVNLWLNFLFLYCLFYCSISFFYKNTKRGCKFYWFSRFPLLTESPQSKPVKYIRYHFLGYSHISVKLPLSSQTLALYFNMHIFLTVLKEDNSSRMFFYYLNLSRMVIYCRCFSILIKNWPRTIYFIGRRQRVC